MNAEPKDIYPTLDEEFVRVRMTLVYLFMADSFFMGVRFINISNYINLLFLVPLLLILIYIFSGFRYTLSKDKYNEETRKYLSTYIFWNLIIYPFEKPSVSKIKIPGSSNTNWNLMGILIPELWFLYHEIWGVFFFIIGGYMFVFYFEAVDLFPINFALYYSLFLRLLLGKYGNLIYYYRHGSWPK